MVNKLYILLYKINTFISINKIAKKALDNYDKKIIKSENTLKIIWIIINPMIKMVIEKKADIQRNNFLTADKFAIFISNLAKI